jgi:hypothetical protein
MSAGGSLSYWIDGEQWLTSAEASRLWRDLTTMQISESTWRRMADDGRLRKMGLTLSDDGKLTNKLSMRDAMSRSLALVADELDRENEAMQKRSREE